MIEIWLLSDGQPSICHRQIITILQALMLVQRHRDETTYLPSRGTWVSQYAFDVELEIAFMTGTGDLNHSYQDQGRFIIITRAIDGGTVRSAVHRLH
jgi:hypothetical protein